MVVSLMRRILKAPLKEELSAELTEGSTPLIPHFSKLHTACGTPPPLTRSPSPFRGGMRKNDNPSASQARHLPLHKGGFKWRLLALTQGTL